MGFGLPLSTLFLANKLRSFVRSFVMLLLLSLKSGLNAQDDTL